MQRHLITSAQITHRFAQHRQHVRTDIQNHAVRVAKRTRVRLAGGKVKRDGFPCGVNSARLLQKPSILTMSETLPTSDRFTVSMRAIQ